MTVCCFRLKLYPRVADVSYAVLDADSNELFLSDISRNLPPEATSTPHQSLRMSIGSSFPSQSSMGPSHSYIYTDRLLSDLLDQDSEMQRAIEDVGSYEDSTSHNEPGMGMGICAFIDSHFLNLQHLHPPRRSRTRKSRRSSKFRSAPHLLHPAPNQLPQMEGMTLVPQQREVTISDLVRRHSLVQPIF